MGITDRRLIDDDENLNQSACTDFSVGTGEVSVLYGSRDKGPAGMLVTRLRRRSHRPAPPGISKATILGWHWRWEISTPTASTIWRSVLLIKTMKRGPRELGRRFIRYSNANGLQSQGYHFITAAFDRELTVQDWAYILEAVVVPTAEVTDDLCRMAARASWRTGSGAIPFTGDITRRGTHGTWKM